MRTPVWPSCGRGGAMRRKPSGRGGPPGSVGQTRVAAERQGLVARARQFDLLLPLAGAGAGLLRKRIPAVRAADGWLVLRRGALGGRQRAAAGMAQRIV